MAGAALGCHVLFVNCGFAPTEIGDESTYFFDATLAPQASALSSLVEGRGLHLAAGGNPLCLALDFSPASSATDRFQLNCTLFEKTVDGAKETADDAQCRFTVSEDAPRQVLLECAKKGAEPCLGSSLELGHMTTNADFVALQSDAAVEGLEVADATDPAVKATLHEKSTYCSAAFSVP